MHLMQQLHLEPTKTAPAVDHGSWIKGQEKKTLYALSMVVIVAFPWCPQTTTSCLYLLYGFKIEGVSIKVNRVNFKINPCQQRLPISLYSFSNAVD